MAITGTDDSETLDGVGGAQTLIGLGGDDTYIVDLKTVGTGSTAVVTLEDTVQEEADKGTDTVQLRGTATLTKATTLTLSANLENLNASNTGTTLLNLVGNEAINNLMGNNANNVLDGSLGADTLVGLAGDDTYVVDIKAVQRGMTVVANIEDTIKEAANAGNDSILVAGSVNLTTATNLTLAENLENLDISNTGLTLLNLIGNDADNKLRGNAASNVLDGGLGNDVLYGGAGSDTLKGGKGDDFYTVDLIKTGAGSSAFALLQDLVKESGNGGTDTLALVVFNASGQIDPNADLGLTTATTITLAANLETLNIANTGKTLLNLAGNKANNTLVGNNAANVLDGGLGNDILYGGLGIDTLKGGKGDDVYLVDLIPVVTEGTTTAQLQDIFTEQANQGKDTLTPVLSQTINLTNYLTIVLPKHIEQINLAQSTNTKLNATGNDASNILWGNNIANTLDGGLGADGMAGGKGDDIYVVDNRRDFVFEVAKEGTDTVQVKIASANKNYTLGDNVENATLTNTVDFKLTGNKLDNVLTGNAAANTLTGNEGNDTLVGGDGKDLLVGSIGKDSYKLAETVAATDIVRIAKGDSLVKSFDTVSDFKLGVGANPAVADKLDLASSKIAADVAAVNGTVKDVIHSHRIANGLITFDDIDNYTSPLTINAGNLASVLAYLQANIIGKQTVAFNAEGNTYVFQDGGDLDTLVLLTGVTAQSISNSGVTADSIWLI